MGRLLRTRTWPWFVLAAVLLIVGLLMPAGIPQSVVHLVAAISFLTACIRQVGFMVRGNPTTAEMVTRRSLEGGVAGIMAEDSGARRRRADAPDSPDR